MADDVQMTDENGRPAVVTIPNVQIVEVGTWHASTGDITITLEHLQDAVTAGQDPSLRRPIVKLGHLDPRFNVEANGEPLPKTLLDAQPAIGRIVNLRLEDNVLVGDLAGIPAWLADVAPIAFPSRSMEAYTDYVTADGRTYRMMLTGVALLGENPPAIESLDDVRSVFFPDDSLIQSVMPNGDGDTQDVSAVADTTSDGGSTHVVVAHTPAQCVTLGNKSATLRDNEDSVSTATGTPVNASINVDDVRRAYYDSVDDPYAWVAAIYTDALIVESGDMQLYRVPWTENDDGTVTFGDHEAVRVDYVTDTRVDDDAPRPEVAASGALLSRYVPARNADARRVDATEPQPTQGGAADDATDSTDDSQERPFMDRDTLIELLRLPADASDEDIQSALVALREGDDENTPTADEDTDEVSLDDDEGDEDTADTGGDDEAPAGVSGQDDAEAEADDEDADDREPVAAGSRPNVPEGMVLIDEDTLAELRRNAEAGRQANDRLQASDRQKIVKKAIQDGRIPVAAKARWLDRFKRDPEGTRTLLTADEKNGGIATGLIPVDGEKGHGDDGETVIASQVDDVSKYIRRANGLDAE